MTKYVIEKNLPMPPAGVGRRKSIYPWQDLEIGDSFVFDGPVPRTQAWSAAKRYGLKFSCRKLDDGTMRIWRVA